MISALWTFVCRAAWNGFIALFVAIIPCIVISFVLWIALIPVSILSSGLAHAISALLGLLLFKIVYFCVFIDLMLDDYELPSLTHRIDEWWKHRNNRI